MRDFVCPLVPTGLRPSTADAKRIARVVDNGGRPRFGYKEQWPPSLW